MANELPLPRRRSVLRTIAGGLGIGLASAGTATAASVAVSTSSPQSVSHCSAALWGSLDEATDVSSVDLTFEWREAGASSWNTTRTETVESTGSVRHYVDGLAQGTSYEYRLTASTGSGASDTGSVVTFDTDGSPTLKGSTDAATDVTDVSAVLNATVDELGDASSAGVLFRWGPPAMSGDFPPNTTLEEEVSTEGGYSAEVDGLDPETTYEYWFVADSGSDVDRGAKRTFTTTSSQLVVDTGLSDDSTDTTITIRGELDRLGGADSVDAFFEYRETGASTWNTTAGQALSAAGTFSTTVENLSEETEYEYRAVGNASDGDTDRGDVLTVTTTGDPEVTTADPTDVTDTSARLRGQVQDTGGASVERSFEWGPAGDVSNTVTDTFIVIDEFGESFFVADISGLDPGTTYEYFAVVDADDGESDTGSVVSFTTTTITTSGPDVDSYSVTAGTKGRNAEITADWAVSDDGNGLESVTVEVIDGGSVVDSSTTSVSGGSASGSDYFKIKKGAGTTYDVRLTVTDADGLSATETRTVTA